MGSSDAQPLDGRGDVGPELVAGDGVRPERDAGRRAQDDAAEPLVAGQEVGRADKAAPGEEGVVLALGLLAQRHGRRGHLIYG